MLSNQNNLFPVDNRCFDKKLMWNQRLNEHLFTTVDSCWYLVSFIFGIWQQEFIINYCGGTRFKADLETYFRMRWAVNKLSLYLIYSLASMITKSWGYGWAKHLDVTFVVITSMPSHNSCQCAKCLQNVDFFNFYFQTTLNESSNYEELKSQIIISWEDQQGSSPFMK